MSSRKFTLPFVLPVAAFAVTILAGSILLSLEISAADKPVKFIDALFISTSSVCVTGLASVDPSQVFNSFGHWVMLILIQLGGLGIVTYSTLIFYILSRRISLTDRLAVGDVLLNDSSFHLGRFLKRIVKVILGLELLGAACLYIMEPGRIGLFNSLFLSVSAFCNAGFALWSDNLIQWRSDWGVNLVIMSLIVAGGIGFAVIDECLRVATNWLKGTPLNPWSQAAKAMSDGGFRTFLPKLSYQTKVVLSTTGFLILVGAILLIIPEYFANDEDPSSLGQLVLPSLFQSVTARTAGFCTVDIGRITDVSLLVLIILMFIGGSPGSCAGGIKTTTFRVITSFVTAQLRGRSQVAVAKKAIDRETLSKAFVLLTFASLTIICATFALAYSEGGDNPHGKTPLEILDLLFEAVSAFATVGLSTNVSPLLSPTGKVIDCLLMFIGRLGPIWLITMIQQFQIEPHYRLPETELPIG